MMNRYICLDRFLVVWVVCISIFITTPALAATTMSATPLGGGNTIRFGRVDIRNDSTSDVRLRISSTDNQQYQVSQRFVEPLVSEQGGVLDQAAFELYTLAGSNSQGTLYQQYPQGAGLNDILLYTSNATGESDSFTVLYQINHERINATGNFSGRILFTLRPIGSGSFKEVIVPVYLEIPAELSLETKTSSGRDVVRLRSDALLDREGYFQIKFDDLLGQPLHVEQEALEWPVNDKFMEFPQDALTVRTFTEGGIGALQDWQPMNRGRQEIFESQDSTGVLQMQYALAEQGTDNITAGIYRGKVRYWLNGVQDDQPIDIVLEINIEPVLKLETEFPTGSLHFTDILPNNPPQLQEVIVRVNSNLGRPYQVTQTIGALPTNDQGDVFDRELFTIRQVLDEGTGKLENKEFSPVVIGESRVFSSDSDGNSAVFRIQYRLKPDINIKAGNYSTGSITLSLGEV